MTVPLNWLPRYGRGKEFETAALAAGRADDFALHIDEGAWTKLLVEYPPKAVPVDVELPTQPPIRGLGDVVWWLASWLPAKWKPRNCRCEARRAWLNKWLPFR